MKLKQYFVASPYKYFGYLGAVWIGASLTALALWNRDACAGALSSPRGPLIALDVCSVLICEVLIAGLLLALSKAAISCPQPAGKILGKTLLITSFAAVTLMVFISSVSWILLALNVGFVSRSSLAATLLDFSSIAPFLSTREWLVLSFTFVISAFVVAVAAALAPTLRRRQLGAITAGLLAALLAMAISFRSATGFQEANVRARLLPTATLFWAPLVLPDLGTTSTLGVPLSPLYDLDAYAATIDKTRPRPNILIFAVESLRAGEVRRVVNGRPVMPTANRLATEGVNFTRAYSQGNESLYSMTSVISGLHPLKTPERDRFTDIGYPLMRIPDVLSPVYHTAFVSSSNEKWQNMLNISKSPHLEYFLDAETFNGPALPPDRADSGFYDEIARGHLRTGALDDATTTQQLNHWLEEKLDAKDHRPFYAMVSYQTSHYPYEQGFHIPAIFTPNTFTPEERSTFSFIYYPEAATARMWNRYWNSLAYIDQQIAATLRLLQERGALENTIVIVQGDHGELFYENGRVTHAAQLHDKTLHVSLVISGAKGVPPGEYNQPVSLLDIGPTVLYLAGMPPNNAFQGSVPAGLRNPALRASNQNRPVFSTVQNIAFEDSVLVGNWKYIEQAQGLYGTLYDHVADPLERMNVADGNTVVADCLRATLHEFRRNQFAYYSNAALTTNYFPPHHDLAHTLACRVTFPIK